LSWTWLSFYSEKLTWAVTGGWIRQYEYKYNDIYTSVSITQKQIYLFQFTFNLANDQQKITPCNFIFILFNNLSWHNNENDNYNLRVPMFAILRGWLIIDYKNIGVWDRGTIPLQNVRKPWEFGQMLGKIKEIRADLAEHMLTRGEGTNSAQESISKVWSSSMIAGVGDQWWVVKFKMCIITTAWRQRNYSKHFLIWWFLANIFHFCKILWISKAF
jgi:hypothetical protein